MYKHEAIAERISQNNPAVLLVRADRAPNNGEPAAIEELSRLFNSNDNVPPTILLANDYDLKAGLESIRVGAKAFSSVRLARSILSMRSTC